MASSGIITTALLLAAAAAAAAAAAPAAAPTPTAPEPLGDEFHHDVDELTVAAGDLHACALERVAGAEVGGEVVCWGDAAALAGALAAAAESAPASGASAGAGVLEPPGGVFVQLSAAARHACGVTLDERAVCWGETAPRALRAGAPAPPAPVLQVSSSAAHACTVDQAGRLACFGGAACGNHRGELDAPREAAFVQVSVGAEQACALRRDGALTCWGSPRGGLLRPPAGQFLQLSVSPGGGSACAVALAGHLECWGAPYGPQGGQGRVNGTFLQVAVGARASCALRADGTLLCWGDERRLRSGGAPLLDGTTFVELTAASNGVVMCAVTSSEKPRVVCFGDVPAITSVPEDLEPAVVGLLSFDL
jgi:hypothetical protein